MELTVIISYYRSLHNLKLILSALVHQSFKDFEVLLSEDDFNPETVDFVLNNTHKYPFSISHLFQQEDNGFRKNQMLNRSIIMAKTEKLVFIDGDCVPHKHFVKTYMKRIKKGVICEGRSVMLSEPITEWTKRNQSLRKLNFISILFSGSELKKEGIYSPYFALSFNQKGRGLLGRNWGICKSDLLDVNGFDEDYIHAGVGEDVDIEWRLKANGCTTVSLKNKAIIFHLYHPRGYSESMVQFNYRLMNEKQNEQLIRCLNGIEKLSK
jgi:GT2 family glycosyltransferase